MGDGNTDIRGTARGGLLRRLRFFAIAARRLFAVAAAAALALSAASFFGGDEARAQTRGERECHYRLFVKPRNVNAALNSCEKLFASGAARSGFWIAEYYNRIGAVSDALGHYQKAAAKGDAFSKYTLGMAHLRKRLGQKRDVEAALKYLRSAARGKYGRAQYIYGFLHDRGGKGIVDLDLKVAWELYQRAAENGDISALVKVGLVRLYEGATGECAPQPGVSEQTKSFRREWYANLRISCDMQKGEESLKKAAQMGDPLAQYELGRFYAATGKEADAARWLTSLLAHKRPLYEEVTDEAGSSLVFAPEKKKRVAAAQARAKKILAGLSDAAKSEAQTSGSFKEHWAAACEYSDHSWFYRCKK